MVAKISTGSNVYGALKYNQQKVDKARGTVLATNILREPGDGKFNVNDTAEELQKWIPAHIRTEKPVLHISLNPDPHDILTDAQLAEIAEKYMARMGWGEQPYIVFKHTDIERTHIHIVSLQVRRDGRKINDSRRNLRSVAATKALEKEYNLHHAKAREQASEWLPTPINAAAGDHKKQIASVLKSLLPRYKFQTLGELRALLSLYNIGLDEVRGTRNGRVFRGMLYTVLNTETPPLKSSIFGKYCGSAALEKQMIRSKTAVEKSLENIRQRITESLDSASRNASGASDIFSETEFRTRLKAHQIDLYLRRNATGRITGATFIDHQTHTALNGSRLGKHFSANALQEKFTAKEIKSVIKMKI